MTPREALDSGELAAAIELQSAVVSANPQEPAARLFLFELLTIAGRLRDARDQLLAVESDDPAWRTSRQSFRQLLRGIHQRTWGKRPAFLQPPPVHAMARWKAFRAIRAGNTERAMHGIDRADANAPPIAGHIDGREFDGLRDSDDRFGSVLEFLHGRHWMWLPFEDIRRLTLSKPVGVLDAVFRPARIVLTNGTEFDAVLPLVYPGSHEADGDFALGQDADWPDCGGPTCGIGARVWLVGEEEFLLADCQQFEFRA